MTIPSSEWAPPPPLPQESEYPLYLPPPPLTKRGEGQHSLAGEGAGGANSDDWRESLALCILCVLTAQGKTMVKILPTLKHTVKKLFDIPVPSRDVTYQTLPGREL